ncbi:hypothetical protein CYLTODRAFT_491798 [Cylindrobasidium torrendii FP15055 ss-10]|uniref:Uncharacterized protein n=1 Tax=Cylindrobasidium torrendii FP15055 ss-10 TaxID=1314674 RepID=A0A0D7B796_9AGAR|nr:hypothetical protein CYLTODRAFT_491798 [Cylindrobasidium torrendii FP15055 ss-10]
MPQPRGTKRPCPSPDPEPATAFDFRRKNQSYDLDSKPLRSFFDDNKSTPFTNATTIQYTEVTARPPPTNVTVPHLPAFPTHTLPAATSFAPAWTPMLVSGNYTFDTAGPSTSLQATRGISEDHLASLSVRRRAPPCPATFHSPASYSQLTNELMSTLASLGETITKLSAMLTQKESELMELTKEHQRMRDLADKQQHTIENLQHGIEERDARIGALENKIRMALIEVEAQCNDTRDTELYLGHAAGAEDASESLCFGLILRSPIIAELDAPCPTSTEEEASVTTSQSLTSQSSFALVHGQQTPPTSLRSSPAL